MRKILAHYDDEGIYIYQAFKPAIVKAAIEVGRFNKGFGLDRLTWIKPSFGWILHRSKYATMHRQEAIIKVKISHQGFLTILDQAIETTYNPDLFNSEDQWCLALEQSDVRFQWDPDRSLIGERLEQRAIQIGISGEMIKRYVNEWALSLTDVTDLAKEIGNAVKMRRRSLPAVPLEKSYSVSAELAKKLNLN